MKYLKGSFSVEAAIIVPLFLFLMVHAIELGIQMTEEVIEKAEVLNNQKKTDVIACMYHLEKFNELLEEINGN